MIKTKPLIIIVVVSEIIQEKSPAWTFYSGEGQIKANKKKNVNVRLSNISGDVDISFSYQFFPLVIQFSSVNITLHFF